MSKQQEHISLRSAGDLIRRGIGLSENMDWLRSETENISPIERNAQLALVNQLTPILLHRFAHLPDIQERLTRAQNGLLFLEHNLATTLFRSSKKEHSSIGQLSLAIMNSDDFEFLERFVENRATPLRGKSLKDIAALILDKPTLFRNYTKDSVDLVTVDPDQNYFWTRAYVTLHEYTHAAVCGELTLLSGSDQVKEGFLWLQEAVCDMFALHVLESSFFQIKDDLSPEEIAKHDQEMSSILMISGVDRMRNAIFLSRLISRGPHAPFFFQLILELVSTGTVPRRKRTPAEKIMKRFAPSFEHPRNGT